MAKGQMRSNREKKKPKQDKNKKKGADAPFKPGTSYTSQYGKKHYQAITASAISAKIGTNAKQLYATIFR